MIVQDETGEVVGANAYVSEADFLAWFSDRGITPAGSTAEREAAIVKATDYIDTRWSFTGQKKATDQTTEFPRYGETELNTKVVTACILYANEALTADLWKTQDEIEAGRIKRKEETVGPIRDVVEYAVPLGTKKAFEQADALMRKSGYVLGGGITKTIGRM